MAKWYRILWGMEDMEGSLEVNQADFRGFDPERLYRGQFISDWPADILFYSTINKHWKRVDDVLWNHYADSQTLRAYIFPIYSAHLQEAVLGVGMEDFEFLPCRVRDACGTEVEGYAMANVLTFRDALDYRKSKVYYRDDTILPRPNVAGNVSAIITAALFEDSVRDCDAFRLPEDPRELFVSEKFRKTYRKIKATGISFDECRVV